MTDKERANQSLPESNKGKSGENRSPVARAKLPPDSEKEVPASEATASKKLTKEEQMALYEKDLKENDWGHQPC